MRRLLFTAPLLFLAACGLDGTDGQDDDREAAETSQAASPNPDLAGLEEVDIRDPEQRPIMRVQVVLDQLGFGPGIVDGKMGLSTENGLQGFQEANGLTVTGKLDEDTEAALARWDDVPATKVVRIPEGWSEAGYRAVPEEPEDQAELEALGYESLEERLAERFHTTPEVLNQLNPGGRPAGASEAGGSPGAGAGASAEDVPAYPPRTRVTPTPRPSASQSAEDEPSFRPGQLVRVPNVGGRAAGSGSADDQDWQRTLASLGVSADQPDAGRIVVDKSEGTLRAYGEGDKLLALFTVTTGSEHDPLPLGEWKINVVSKNPPFNYNPDLFWDAKPGDEKVQLPPGPNGPVGVVWIDLSKEHYGIHGTPEPQTIGRAQSHGCVRLANWDAARLAQMVGTSTKVIFQA